VKAWNFPVFEMFKVVFPVVLRGPIVDPQRAILVPINHLRERWALMDGLAGKQGVQIIKQKLERPCIV
jgi:hypothetical protein